MAKIIRTVRHMYYRYATPPGNYDYNAEYKYDGEIYPQYITMAKDELEELKSILNSVSSINYKYELPIAGRNNNEWVLANEDKLLLFNNIIKLSELVHYVFLTDFTTNMSNFGVMTSGYELFVNKSNIHYIYKTFPYIEANYSTFVNIANSQNSEYMLASCFGTARNTQYQAYTFNSSGHAAVIKLRDGLWVEDSSPYSDNGVVVLGLGLFSIDSDITSFNGSISTTFPIIVDNGKVAYLKYIMSTNRKAANDYQRGSVWVELNTGYSPLTISSSYGQLIIGADPYNPEQPSDPFGDGGTSETGGGGGSFDFESADIPESPLPTLNATATGFTRVFNPSLTQLNALASYLWTTDSFWETVFNHTKQLLENPMQYMIALNMLPVAVPQGSSQSVKFLWIDTGVSMPPVTNQFVDVDCGTYTFNPIYGSALDYSPYTEIELFLPFIGLVQLDTDEVMGKTIQVKYRVDVFTGICVASILVNGSVLYQHQGTCAISIPFSGADFTRYVSAVTTIAKAGISVASASPNAISGSDTTSSNYNNHVYPVTIANAVTNSVAAVVGSKPTIEHTGSFGAVSGYLGTRYCWVNIKAPRMANPDKYGAYNGYPTMVTMNLSECSGFTKVQSIYLNGFGQATADELSELDELLKSGVYL